MANRWTVENIPDQKGKIAVITGANSGLGFEVARALAGKNATVIIASRDTAKGEQAAARIRAEFPQAQLEVMALDLADLDAVRRFAENFAQKYSSLHLLINNAGVMALPYRETKQGFEMQFGTNHLGHFALTGLLLPLLLKTEGARIVNVSSGMHHRGVMNFTDLQSKVNYKRWAAYGQSKLANLLFTYELQRKLAASGAPVIAVAAHPGYAATNLQTAGPLMSGSNLGARLSSLGNAIFAQSAAMGALPLLYAATAPDVKSGEYFGPDGLMEMRGYPTRARSSERSHNQEDARKLWEVSEKLTGVKYESLSAKV